MKINIQIAAAVYETKYGTDIYVRHVKKTDSAEDVMDQMAKDCGFDPCDDGEYFNADIKDLIIDTDDCRPA